MKVCGFHVSDCPPPPPNLTLSHDGILGESSYQSDRHAYVRLLGVQAGLLALVLLWYLECTPSPGEKSGIDFGTTTTSRMKVRDLSPGRKSEGPGCWAPIARVRGTKFVQVRGRTTFVARADPSVASRTQRCDGEAEAGLSSFVCSAQ